MRDAAKQHPQHRRLNYSARWKNTLCAEQQTQYRAGL